MTIVGLPDAAIQESREPVQAAVRNTRGALPAQAPGGQPGPGLGPQGGPDGFLPTANLCPLPPTRKLGCDLVTFALFIPHRLILKARIPS